MREEIKEIVDKRMQLSALNARLQENLRIVRLLEVCEDYTKSTPEETVAVIKRYLEDTYQELKKEAQKFKSE